MIPSNQASIIQTSPIARALVRFLRWWKDELAVLIPQGLQSWLGNDGQAILLTLDGEQARFERRIAGRNEMISEVMIDPEKKEIQGAALKRQLAQQAGQGYHLLLSLPVAQTLRRSLQLPLATEENLAQTLAYELDRYTPFKPDEVYFDYRIQHRDPSRKIIELDLAIIRRSVADPLKLRAAELGLPVQGLAFNGEILGGHLTPGWDQTAPGTSSFRLWRRVALAVLAVALLVTLLGIPVWQKRAAAIALLEPLANARKAANETDAMRERLEQLVVEYNALPEKKWASPSLLRILDEISRHLKDDTFVLNFSLDGKTVTLQGESGSGAELVEVLEASPLIHNVVFKSPLTKLPGGTVDRFHIGGDITPEEMPKPALVPPGDKS